MSKHIDVMPQRRVGNEWKQCAEHQAQRFAVVNIKRLTISGKPQRQVKVLASFKSKAEALIVRDNMHSKGRNKRASKARPEGLPQPGSRMDPRPEGVKVIAQSLTQEQYNALTTR